MLILFVCTGNTCRSPMAAFLLRQKLREANLPWQVDSAGTFAADGQPMSHQAAEALQTLGVPAEGHQAKGVHRRLLERAEYVFTMTVNHARQLSSTYPEMARKISTLGEFLAPPNEAVNHQPEEYDIVDPFGSSDEQYLHCAEQLNHLMDLLIQRLTSEQAATRGSGAMKVIVGSDHAGFRLKRLILPALQEEDYEIQDIGTFTEDSVDYPDYALQVAQAVASGEYDRGLLICGTGLGMCIAANKVRGIRAVTVQDEFSAEMARRHNDANILTLGERVIGPGLALEIVKVFLTTEFEGGRHGPRVNKILEIERRSL